MALSGRAAAVAVAGVLVVLAVRSLATVAVVDGLLLAGIFLDVALAAPVRALRVSRDGDTRVRLGEPATVTTVIENTSARPLRAQLRDAWPPSARASTGQASLRLPAGGRGKVTVTVAPARHGDCVSERVTIRSFGPLGLAARQRGQRVPWTVRALPPFHSRRYLPGKLAQLRELDGLHRTVRPGQGSEFDSLREYVVGDDVRSIDWRSSARHRDVMVRTWRPERDRRIVLVLDTGRTAAGRVAGYPRLDTAMDAAQLLTALASKAGDRVDLIAVDQRIRARVLAPARTTALAAVTDALASVQPELAETDWRLVTATCSAVRRTSVTVAFRLRVMPASAPMMLAWPCAVSGMPAWRYSSPRSTARASAVTSHGSAPTMRLTRRTTSIATTEPMPMAIRHNSTMKASKPAARCLA